MASEAGLPAAQQTINPLGTDVYYIIIYIISYHIVSYHIVSYHIISYHIISYHTTPYHIISYHILSYHILSYHIISYHIISYHIISYHIISYHIISYHIIRSMFIPYSYQTKCKRVLHGASMQQMALQAVRMSYFRLLAQSWVRLENRKSSSAKNLLANPGCFAWIRILQPPVLFVNISLWSPNRLSILLIRSTLRPARVWYGTIRYFWVLSWYYLVSSEFRDSFTAGNPFMGTTHLELV